MMLGVGDAIPSPRDLAKAEFSTPRLRLSKIAARVIEPDAPNAFSAGSVRESASGPDVDQCGKRMFSCIRVELPPGTVDFSGHSGSAAHFLLDGSGSACLH
jgi:hypothetical protein